MYVGLSAGTGYLTAAFALLVGREGRAVGVEHIPELTEQAIKNVKKSKANHLLASGCLSIHTGGILLFLLIQIRQSDSKYCMCLIVSVLVF